MLSSRIKPFAITCLCSMIFLGAWWGITRALHFKSMLDWRISPTYRANSVAADLKKICAKDYKLRVETHRSGNTLQAYYWRAGLFKPGPAIGENELQDLRPESIDALDGILSCTTRISLSSDAPLEFLEVKLEDILTGATVTLWRYVPDIHDLMYRFGEEEYFNRLVVEVDTKGRKRGKQEWSELTWGPPMTMTRFLAKQVVRRTIREGRLKEVDLQAHEGISRPGTLVVVLEGESDNQGSKEVAKVTDLFKKTTRTVIDGYQFKGFHEFVLQDNRGMSLGRWPL